MIRCDRGDPPEDLDGTRYPDCSGAQELRKAREYFRTATAGFKFAAYGLPSVRAALKARFHGKCAYCESKILTDSIQVEHFRPKAAVRVGSRLAKPAYWWLGSVWTNLLPACAL